MNTRKTNYDVAIIGGGFVGHSLIAALAPAINKGLKVAILEVNQPTSDTSSYSPAFDDRSTALSLGSSNLFLNWNLWSKISKHATQVESIEVSEKNAFQTLTLDSKPDQQSLGFIVPNAWLGHCLLENTQKLKVDQIYGVDVSGIKFDENYANVIQNDNTEITASMVILADGGRSDLKKKLGILTDELDFHQSAIIANITTERTHQNCAFERFTEIGPMAMLPLSLNDAQNTCALVWSVSPERANLLKSLSDDDFLKQGELYFGGRLGKWTQVSSRASYPLIRKYSSEQVRSRFALVGNSALSLHPVAGQGLNIGLRAVSALAQQLQQQHQNQAIGNLPGLLTYKDKIHKDQQLLMRFCDSLISIYEKPILKIPRSIGLGLLDHHTFSKSLFSAVAKGIAPGQLFERNQ